MSRTSTILPAMSLALLLGWPAANAVAADDHAIVTTDTMKWEPIPILPSGADWSMLSGSPAESGPFTFRIRLPDGYVVPAHWHSMDETVTVISGTFGLGMGEQADRSKVTPLSAGSYVHLPAKSPHYVVATGQTVVQVSGTGPFDFNYVNPAEDPRTQVGSTK